MLHHVTVYFLDQGLFVCLVIVLFLIEIIIIHICKMHCDISVCSVCLVNRDSFYSL